MIAGIIITVGSDVPILLSAHFIRLLKETVSLFHLQFHYKFPFFVRQFHANRIASSTTL